MTATEPRAVQAADTGRLAWADALRVAALLAVIVIHISTRWLEGAPPAAAAALLAWDGGARWCVPVFVMLSGMFHLDPDRAVTGRGLLRQIARLLAAILFWGLFYRAVGLLLAGGNPLTVLPDLLARVLSGDTRYHLWFVYMMIGLYLVTPFLREMVKNRSGGGE